MSPCLLRLAYGGGKHLHSSSLALALSLLSALSLSLYCLLCSCHGLAKLRLELGCRYFHYSASLRIWPSAPSPPSRSLPCPRALAGATSLGAAAALAWAATACTCGQSAASCFGTGGAHLRVLCGRPVSRGSPTPAPVPRNAATAAATATAVCPLPPLKPRHFKDEIRDVRSLVPRFSAPAAS
jgi:hypothetical protein